MTKKDYIRIARALTLARVKSEDESFDQFEAYTQTIRFVMSQVTEQMYIELKEDNPLFNPERFRIAVNGLKEGK